eukprot:413720-Rhodomonas_salina.1
MLTSAERAFACRARTGGKGCYLDAAHVLPDLTVPDHRLERSFDALGCDEKDSRGAARDEVLLGRRIDDAVKDGRDAAVGADLSAPSEEEKRRAKRRRSHGSPAAVAPHLLPTLRCKNLALFCAQIAVH